MKTLHEFIQEKSSESDKVKRKRRRDEWTTAVRLLMGKLYNWLKEADPEGWLDIATPMVEKREQGLGTYHAMSLEVGFGDDTIKVVPVARKVLGFVIQGSGAVKEAVPAQG